jgi:hypothetical protein
VSELYNVLSLGAEAVDSASHKRLSRTTSFKQTQRQDSVFFEEPHVAELRELRRNLNEWQKGVPLFYNITISLTYKNV